MQQVVAARCTGVIFRRRASSWLRAVQGSAQAMLCAMLAWAGIAQAQTDASGDAVREPARMQNLRDPPRSDVQWLQRIQSAAQRMSYAGTVVYQRGGEVRASRLVHYFDGQVSHERLQPLDGRPREFIRRADEVQCLMPESKRIVIEHRLAPDAFPAIATADPAEILQHYAVRLGDVERVAGMECQVIHIEPKDRMRYGYRLWVDRASGLLLRAVTLNDRGEVIEQMAFAEVRIGERIDRSSLKPSWPTEGWRVERTEQRAADFARLGWHITAPAGFRKLREVMRSLWGHTGAGSERVTMQAIYTDGIANVSVFVEPAVQVAVVEAAHADGPTHVYARRVADARVTVVGEVPLATVKALGQSVEYRAPK